MKRAFFFHFNKPASQREGKPQVSVHFKGACHMVDNVVCDVPTVGRSRKTQPKFVMCGLAENLEIKNGIATIS